MVSNIERVNESIYNPTMCLHVVASPHHKNGNVFINGSSVLNIKIDFEGLGYTELKF